MDSDGFRWIPTDSEGFRAKTVVSLELLQLTKKIAAPRVTRTSTLHHGVGVEMLYQILDAMQTAILISNTHFNKKSPRSQNILSEALHFQRQVTIIRQRSKNVFVRDISNSSDACLMNDKKILDLHSTTDYLVYTWLIEGIVMKPGKVPCCMFLSASLGLTLHRTWQNSKRWLCWVMCVQTRKKQTTNGSIAIM